MYCLHSFHYYHFYILSSPSSLTDEVINAHRIIIPLISSHPFLFFIYTTTKLYIQMLRLLSLNPISNFTQLGFSRFLNCSKIITVKSRMGSSFYTTSSSQSSKLLFRQLFEKESSTYTYLLADASHPEKPALVSYSCSMNIWFFFVSVDIFLMIVSGSVRVCKRVNYCGFLSLLKFDEYDCVLFRKETEC